MSETRAEYTIEPPFDEDLNKRLNAGKDPSEPEGVSLAELIEQAVAEEREACASTADVFADDHPFSSDAARFIADKIRAREGGQNG